MSIQKSSDFLIINNVKMPVPATGFTIVQSQNVDSGRNLNGAVVGQLVGRKLWKLNNLSFKGLDPISVQEILTALEPFFVPVTFTGTDNKRHTIYMYPGDTTGKPLFVKGTDYTYYESLSFNLIDCGWD